MAGMTQAEMDAARNDIVERQRLQLQAQMARIWGNIEAPSDPARWTLAATQEADEPILLGQRIERAGAP